MVPVVQEAQPGKLRRPGMARKDEAPEAGAVGGVGEGMSELQALGVLPGGGDSREEMLPRRPFPEQGEAEALAV